MHHTFPPAEDHALLRCSCSPRAVLQDLLQPQDRGTLSPRPRTFGHRESIFQPQLPQHILHLQRGRTHHTLHPQLGRVYHRRRPQLKRACIPGPQSLPQTQRRSFLLSLLAILFANHPAASVECATTPSSS